MNHGQGNDLASLEAVVSGWVTLALLLLLLLLLFEITTLPYPLYYYIPIPHPTPTPIPNRFLNPPYSFPTP